jgi:hypothetical protein
LNNYYILFLISEIPKGRIQMHPNDLVIFNQAVALVQSGQKEAAYTKLKVLRRSYPEEVNCLLWLAFTTSNLDEAEEAIQQAEALDPGNSRLTRAKEWLDQEKLKRPAPSAWPPVNAYPPQPEFNSETPSPAFFESPPPPGQAGAFTYQQPIYQTPPPLYYQQPPVYYYQQPPMIYYPTGRPIPRVQMSTGVQVGYFCLYSFISCLALLVIGVTSYLISPSHYDVVYSYHGAYEITSTWFGIIFLTITTSIWATMDASRRRSKFGIDSATHPLVVLISCIFLWILAFPLFLTSRRKAIAYYGS